MLTYKPMPAMILLIGLTTIACQKETPPEPSPERITIAGYTYANFNGVWYTVIDGKQGDRVDLGRLVVRPKPGVDMLTFDYQSLGIPELEILATIASEYYVLDTSQLGDPFEVAGKLWDTDKFVSLQFDVIVAVHTN